MSELDHIAREEFQNFRQDVGEHFKLLHECDRRIEKKIDALTEKIEPVIAEYNKSQQRRKSRWEMKLLIFGAALGAGFSIIATLALAILGK
jgi:hypothetical protein